MPISITKNTLNQLLREIAILSAEEREYVKAVFGKYLSGGISKWEAEQAIRQMQINYQDTLSAEEVGKIKEKILAAFNA